MNFNLFYRDHTFTILEVNKLPYKLQEVCAKYLCFEINNSQCAGDK